MLTKLTAVSAALAGSSAFLQEAVKDVGPFINETWYTGLVDVNHKDGRKDDIFYWAFESRNDAANDPLVLWLTGGPGCASEIALFYENGPYQFEEDGKTLKSNPYSWNNNANVIYVDQPVGTGFSQAAVLDLSTNEDEVAENMAQMMMGFLEEHPDMQGKDFYITGESYAGHYIPAISHNFMFKHAEDLKINFKGMAIGNGLVDPYTQYPEYDEFAYENNLVNKTEYEILKGAFKACDALINTKLWPVSLEVCQLAVTVILGNPLHPKFNTYDIREPCSSPPMCYDFSPADNMMMDADIQKVLGVEGRKWKECNMLVHTAMLGDWMKSLSKKVTDILEGGLDVLVYSGDKDFICNWRGGEAWTNAVDWSHKEEFQGTDYVDWNVNGKAAGALKAVENLKFLRVFDAGHMVPMNQPVAALEMLHEFIINKPLA